jgi:hypothetical protein
MTEALNRRAARRRSVPPLARSAVPLAARRAALPLGRGAVPVPARRAVLPFLFLLLALVVSGRAEAHATSTSYLVAETRPGEPAELDMFWGLSVAQTNWALDLDQGGDGLITWGEIDARRDDIAEFAARHLSVARGGTSCTVTFQNLQLTTYSDEPHLSLAYLAKCPASDGPLELQATAFFEDDATQRTLVDISTPAGQFTSVLSADSPRWVESAAPSALSTFFTFVGQGVWHVWIGYDHLVFLLLLLLPSVLRGMGDRWQGTHTFRDTAWDLLRIVTAFTVAHSITLGLAATGTVHVPVRPIEIAIAASIVIAGVLNLFPGAARARLALAFGFGLIHGFGFANALAELGTGGARLVPTLAGFNVGVELAQISLVVLVLPFLFRARNSSFYAGRFMPLTSIVAALAGAAWLVARTG